MATHLHPLCTTISISSHSHLSPRPILAKTPRPPRHCRFTVSCNAGNGERTPSSQSKVDRRHLLVGMGGLYGAANLLSTDSPALAKPILAPVLEDCKLGKLLSTGGNLSENCCPPTSKKFIDYNTLRIRPAAHKVNGNYIKKYEAAIKKMKELPLDDPRNFMQQANVHCAYCNLSYPQTNQPDKENMLQIHNNWLFLPWHRWYLYFYERILGHLIEDSTFALPYWSWDSLEGIAVPPLFTKGVNSPLYDSKRNKGLLKDRSPPPPVDLSYANNKNPPGREIIEEANLREMYTTMVRTQCLEDFYGKSYSTGSTVEDSGPGAIERGPHTAVHMWVGQDMGDFSTAGRDPLFFSHHANVDRLWSIWCKQRSQMKRSTGFEDTDWLDTEFLFYNENKDLVRVTVKDALDEEKMGYTYDTLDLPWENKRPKPRLSKSTSGSTEKTQAAKDASSINTKLDDVLRVLVKRPKPKRTKEDKQKEEEILVIKVQVESASFVRFDVYVNDNEENEAGVDDLKKSAAYAGCYSQIPTSDQKTITSTIRLALNDLLEDLKVGDDEEVLVSIVPRVGNEFITITGINIDSCSLA